MQLNGKIKPFFEKKYLKVGRYATDGGIVYCNYPLQSQ
jgi:hypothetical protein